MSIMLVGADYLGGIEKNLQAMGIASITHVSGRDPMERGKIHIPKTVSLIVVLTDYVNHNTAAAVKRLAKSQGVPLVYSKRSWSALNEKIAKLKIDTMRQEIPMRQAK